MHNINSVSLKKTNPRLRVLITGASRGIGRAIAIECAKRGSIVGANFCHSSAAAESLEALFPNNIRSLQFNVQDFDAVHKAFNSFIDDEGAIDVLVNNAGIGARPQFLVKASKEVIDEIIGVNLLGTIYCTHAALPSMMKARCGQIINVSSIAAIDPTDGITAYAASKSGGEGLAVAVAKEYVRRGIRSCAVRLGLVRTDMTKDLISYAQSSGITVNALEPDIIATAIADIIFGRVSYHNGQIIDLSATLANAMMV